MGIGDWGLGIGPNPQSPIPNPQSPIPINNINGVFIYYIILYLKFLMNLNCLCINLFNMFDDFILNKIKH